MGHARGPHIEVGPGFLWTTKTFYSSISFIATSEGLSIAPSSHWPVQDYQQASQANP
jgi:hypothetical protein